MTVYFIGAGPGDPELITVKGQRLVRKCPVILYAGSLVPEAVLDGHQAHTVVNTAELDLDAIVALLGAAHARGEHVARVHSGDPSLYGAIGEQIRRLKALGIPYEIVPGVTATAACAATLGVELTLPGVAQTVILTRYAGKTTLPEGEALGGLAAHRATLAIHLGVRHLARIVEEVRPHYGDDCPVAVVYRASWPDETRVTGTLADIIGKIAGHRDRADRADPDRARARHRSLRRFDALREGFEAMMKGRAPGPPEAPAAAASATAGQGACQSRAGMVRPRCTAGRATKRFQHARHVREVLELHQLARLVEADQVAHPREGGDVGDGVVARPRSRCWWPGASPARRAAASIRRRSDRAGACPRSRVPANLWKKPSWPNIGPIPPIWNISHWMVS